MRNRRRGAQHYEVDKAGCHLHPLRLNYLPQLSTLKHSQAVLYKVTDQTARPCETSKSLITLGLQNAGSHRALLFSVFMGKEVETGGHAISG
jgi:hypothetical protein